MGGFGATGHQAAAITHDLDHPFLPTYLNLESRKLVSKQHFNTKESRHEKHCRETSMLFWKVCQQKVFKPPKPADQGHSRNDGGNVSIITRYGVDPKSDR